ncbi:hypothetical protein [Streptomyces melanogenes]|uniref:Secreted protein n=1 Tax=Streptomyces melanogenes TaxID=67326 RepID=A0ABZ1XDL7_9ACTN|nr:hypothetical protein [Streptomyces melanogenes]
MQRIARIAATVIFGATALLTSTATAHADPHAPPNGWVSCDGQHDNLCADGEECYIDPHTGEQWCCYWDEDELDWICYAAYDEDD